ncbi:uncharacterized protein LOC114213355 [Eumetopias jubatus]|uniref:uncharacterized protein LOC114213355 n=1 Tax=Eumetopias jubatus TaxID=34886 RepID=UPI00101680A4|nr:uncharacterized protein LOC114213355 [Eumetopias jubatus]
MTHKCLSQDEAAEGNLGGARNRGAPARRARQAKFPSLPGARSWLFPVNLPAPAALALCAGWEAILEAGQESPATDGRTAAAALEVRVHREDRRSLHGAARSHARWPGG